MKNINESHITERLGRLETNMMKEMGNFKNDITRNLNQDFNTLNEQLEKRLIAINEKVNEKFYLVPYQTISGEYLIKCFNPKRVYIDGIGDVKNISVGIINKKFNGYNCLLNNKILEERW